MSANGPATSSGVAVYSGSGRNRLCLEEGRAGLIVYAASGDANCSVRGTAETTGGGLVIRPDGDQSCRIEARASGESLTLGPVAPACAYYCGPGASYSGATFDAAAAPQPVSDVAGDQLC